MVSGADRPAGSCVRGSLGRVFTRSGQIALEQNALCSALTHMTDWVGPPHTHTHTQVHSDAYSYKTVHVNKLVHTCTYKAHTICKHVQHTLHIPNGAQANTHKNTHAHIENRKRAPAFAN